MKLQTSLLLVAVFVLTFLGALEVGEKTLTIERYPGEPLQLVDLKISGQSVKDQITVKARYENKWGSDIVKLTEKDDWYRRLFLTFRNVSEKPIYGVEANLFFEPVGGQRKMYGAPMKSSKELWQNPLQPGEEVELMVGDFHLDQILQVMKGESVEVNNCKISFSLDTAIYNEKLRWYRGALLQPDPEVPNKWIPVKKAAP